MNTIKEWSKILRTWTWWRWAITGLSLFAAILSISLSWHFISGATMIGCGGGSSCDEVLTSKWSKLIGALPVSSLAVGVYLSIFVSNFFIGSDTEVSIRRLAWTTLLVLVGAVSGSALWLMGVQKWIIGAFCPYCMTTHISGLILTVLVVWRALKEPFTSEGPKATFSTKKKSLFRPFKALLLLLVGLFLSAMLVAFQIGLSPKTVYKDGASTQTIPELDYSNVPMVGPIDAPYKVTMLFDYNCSHCQKIHFMLQEAVRQYDGKLAIVLCPTPLNTHCNPFVPRDVDAFKNSCELTEISLAVWHANREAFPEFENWMFTYDTGDRWTPRTLEAAKSKAIQTIGSSKFDAALSDPWIANYMKSCINIFGRTLQDDKGGIPKLIYGSRWVIPVPNNADALIELLQSSLALPKP